MPRFSRVAWVTAVLYAVYVAVMVGGWATGRTVSVFDSVVSVIVPAIGAVFSAISVASTHQRQRSARLALTFGLTAATIAEAIWAYYKITEGKSPFPSAADFAYLLFPVGVLAALLLFPAGGSRQSRTRLLLDGVIVAASLLIVAWLTVMRPIYQGAGKTSLEMFVSLAYPVSHVATLTVAAVALSRSVRLPLTPLALGLGCMTLAEVGYAYVSSTGYIATHHLINVGWMAGMVLIMLATAVGNQAATDAEPGPEMPGWASTLLPYAPVILAGIVLALEPPDQVRATLVVTSGVFLGVAVLARQLLAVAENRRLLATVADRAMRDPLTGLANRALFQDRLEHALQLRQRDGRSTGILSLDLNDFKLVNDTMGHPAGDELLTGCAARLMDSVRTGDTVARLGGDEFAVLLEGRLDQWIPVTARIIDAFDQPFVVDGQELLIRPSAGLAVAGPGDEADISAEELLKRADVAMYSAKRSRGRGVFTYRADMSVGEHADAQGPPGTGGGTGADSGAKSGSYGPIEGAALVQFLGELRQAIDQSELTLVYQPQFSAATGQVVGVEALLRWPHPDRGLLSPEEFLPLVRQHGMMGAVTDLVIDTALDDAARWHAAGVGVPVAVNLFAPLLSNPDLPQQISRALADRELDGSALTVEITEDLFPADMAGTKAVLKDLRARGIRIAIDDFGSGYSALSYLSDLPIDEVKFAHSFMAPAMTDQRAATVLGAAVDLSHRLGLVTVAEGVENAEIAARMPHFGCDVLQGYYLSAPLTAAEFVGRMRRAELAYAESR